MDKTVDAIELLIADHREVEVLFKQFKDETDEECKAGIAHMVCMCLTAHTVIEEEFFYPAAEKVLNDKVMFDDAKKEHAEAKQLIAKIEVSSGTQLEQLMSQLEAAIAHHVNDEESKMFPQLQQAGMETTDLGMEMLECKMECKVELMMK
jgi:hemerythrin superfamily protein